MSEPFATGRVASTGVGLDWSERSETGKPGMLTRLRRPIESDPVAPPDVGHRLERLVPVVLVFGVFLAAVLSITPWPVGAYEDDAIYTLLAKALATGDGYRMINLPGTPHATHYPPGYPFVLSLLWRLSPQFPDNVVVFKFANAVLLAVAAGGAYWFARGRLGYSAVGAAVVAAAGTASITMLHLAGLVLSEPLFVALLFLAIPSLERSVSGENLRDAVIAGALLGALATVRTIGVVAIGAAILVLLLHRRFRAAAVIVTVSALFLVPWQLWVSAHQGEIAPILVGKYGSYGGWLADGYREGRLAFARDVVIQNLAGMGNTLSYLVMPAQVRWPRLLALMVLAPTLIAGLVVLWKRAPVLVAFFTLYVMLIAVWPFDPHRFLLALWPVIVLALGAVAQAAWQRRRASGLRFLALGAVGFLGAGHAAYNWRGYQEQSWAWLQQRAGESARPLVEWVARYTRPEDVLSTEHDVVVYLYTGRRGVPTTTFLASQRVKRFTAADDARWMGTMVQTFQPRYLITGWPAHITAADSLSAGAAPVLRRLGSIPSHTVYERVVR